MSATVYEEGLTELAEIMASRGCVWFIGAGFSMPSKMPDVSKLALTMLQNAVVGVDLDSEELRVRRYETIKRVLLGSKYAETGLKYRDKNTKISMEIMRSLVKRTRKPPWYWQLLSLGRLADILHRTSAGTTPSERDIDLASWMGLEDNDQWVKPPSVAHHLLALLSVEGLVNRIITTNYDEQLEDACKEIGFTQFRTVRSAHEYSRRATADLSHGLEIYKIHGCRTWYLNALQADRSNTTRHTQKELGDAAAAFVITDRQLQHWRSSKWSWARDLFQDLLRWRPFIFVGFSASDAVLQATLNAVAEEVEGTQAHVFVAPSLSFSFYQLFSQHDRQFDPSTTRRVLDARAEKLLPDLYPKALKAHFSRVASSVDAVTVSNIATTFFGITDQAVLEAACESAVAAIGVLAEQLARAAVEDCSPFDVEVSAVPVRHVPCSTTRRLLHNMDRNGECYPNLDAMRADLRCLVQVLAVMLARTYPSVVTLRSLEYRVDHDTENATFWILDSVVRSQVAFIPLNAEMPPELWLAIWLQDFFSSRKTYAFPHGVTLLYGAWVKRADLSRAVQNLGWRKYGAKFNIDIWCLGSRLSFKGGQ